MINRMKLDFTKTKLLALFFVFLILQSCDSDVQNTAIDDLNVRFTDGLAFSDLMPNVEPDPIYIRIELEMYNANTDDSFNNIRVPKASMFLDSSDEYLGDIDFSTEWDGHLESGEIDTITFVKNTSASQAPFSPPCGSMIYLEVDIRSDDESKQVMSDSLWYGRAY